MATIGVKIELEGAPQYNQNMQNLTAQTKLYQAQVKRLTAEMGSGVSAFQKSITQSKALEQQLEAQKNQSKLLEEQIQKSIEKYGEESTQVIKLKTQYENLQTQIAKTNSALEENGGVWGAIGAEMDAIGNKCKEVGDKISSVGDSLTKGLTAPITALGAASAKAWSEVDEGMDTIIKKTGATGEALEGLTQVAENIATSIPTSFDEVGNAVGEVNTRFGLTGDELEDLSKQFIEFADLNGTSVSNSIDNVQAAMAAFNLDATEAGTVLDILNKAGQDTGISVDTLASNLLTSASAMTEMGFDINEAAGFIANLEKNGVDASSTMSGLKKAFANAAKDGISMEDALKDLETSLKDTSGETNATETAIELFGAKAGPAIAKAVQEGKLSFDSAANSIKDFGDSVGSTFDATVDPIDEFQVNMNKLKLVGADVINTAAPLISNAMEKMAEVIQKVSDAWNGLSEDQQQMIINVALVVATIGPVLSIVGRVVSSLSTVFSIGSTIAGFIPTIISAVSTVGTVLMGTVIPAIGGVIAALVPFLPIIAAVAAAVAAIVLVVKNWGTITDWLTEKWEAFTSYISEKVAAIQTFFEENFGLFGELVSTKIEIVKIIIQTAIEVIKTIFITFGQVLKALFTGDWQAIGDILSKAWESIKQTIKDGIAKIKLTIQQLLQSIKDKFSELKNMGKEWGEHLIQNFIDGVLAKWEALKQTVANVANTVKDFLGFTEPKEGPLHNFNSWPRHMMENYANGIEEARFLVRDAVNNVAQDVTIMANPMDVNQIYDAVRSGASDATLNVAIGEREFSRTLRSLGVQF